MSSLPKDCLIIYIKHEEGRNEKPILCNKDDTVYELAEAVKENAEKFLSAFDGMCAKKVDLEIYHFDKGNKVVLKPREKIERYVDKELLFNIGHCIYLERVDKKIGTKSVTLDYHTQTLDLIKQMCKEDQHLGLSNDEKESVKNDEKLIEIYIKEQDGDGKKIPLESNKNLMDFKGRTLTYELIDPSFRVYLGRVDKPITEKIVTLGYNDETLDLVTKISKGGPNLGLSDKEIESVGRDEKLIKVYEKAQQRGDLNIPLENNRKLRDVHGKTLVYELTDRNDRMPLSSVSEFIEVCNGQNIALFGEPRHGKSATINSFVRVIKGVHLQTSQTAGGSAKGTVACTSKRFEFSSSNTGNSYFTVWDVPGLTKKQGGGDSNLNDNIINILNGNFTEEKWPDDMKVPVPKSKHNEKKKIHAAICVVKGIAPDTLQLPTSVRRVCTHEGHNTPFFVVVTHEDKFAAEEKNKEDIIENISTCTGTDKSCIFTIANRDHLPSDQRIENDIDITREREILRTLKMILGAAYNEKEKKSGAKATAEPKEERKCCVL